MVFSAFCLYALLVGLFLNQSGRIDKTAWCLHWALVHYAAVTIEQKAFLDKVTCGNQALKRMPVLKNQYVCILPP